MDDFNRQQCFLRISKIDCEEFENIELQPNQVSEETQTGNKWILKCSIPLGNYGVLL